jgi:truncated hemoglobin YjbI
MPIIPIEVDEDLKQQMDRHPAVDWDEVARDAMRERARTLELMDELVDDVDLSDADAAELADTIDEIARERIEEES